MTVKQQHQVQTEIAPGEVVLTDLLVERLPSRDWKMIATIPGAQPILVEGSDLFECLRAARRVTDHSAIRFLCNGARRDTWPSGMLRDMNGASKVYCISMGKQAQSGDLVPIFGHAASEFVGTVEEQDQYHRDWLRSLNNAPETQGSAEKASDPVSSMH